jgi:hypothetical protein
LETDQKFSFGEAFNGAKVEILDLENSGKKDLSDFKTYPERLSNVLKALGEVEDARKNLHQIRFGREDIEEDVVIQMLKDSNFDHVDVKYF